MTIKLAAPCDRPQAGWRRLAERWVAGSAPRPFLVERGDHPPDSLLVRSRWHSQHLARAQHHLDGDPPLSPLFSLHRLFMSGGRAIPGPSGFGNNGGSAESADAASLGPRPQFAGPAATREDLDLPQTLTPAELATFLRLRPRSVYEAIRRREIPGVQRIGRKVRIHRDTIIRWLADGQGRVSRSPRRTE